MILADTVTTLTTLSPQGIAQVLDKSGYSMCSFKTAKFLGITNGGDFCYRVTFHDEAGTGEAVGKVFVRYDSATGFITAEF